MKTHLIKIILFLLSYLCKYRSWLGVCVFNIIKEAGWTIFSRYFLEELFSYPTFKKSLLVPDPKVTLTRKNSNLN